MRKLRYWRKQFRENREAMLEANRARYPKIRERECKRYRDRYWRDPEVRRKASRAYYRKNRRKVIDRANARASVLRAVAPGILTQYRKNAERRAPHKKTARAALRRASQVNATPFWADRAAIDETYALAKLMTQLLAKEYVVDHIVPLRNKKVCGLHVPANLQVISAEENAAKSNRVWPGMPK